MKEIKISESKLVNNILLHKNKNGIWVDNYGDSGYHAHFTGAWICYNCGHLCYCGE